MSKRKKERKKDRSVMGIKEKKETNKSSFVVRKKERRKDLRIMSKGKNIHTYVYTYEKYI